MESILCSQSPEAPGGQEGDVWIPEQEAPSRDEGVCRVGGQVHGNDKGSEISKKK